MRQIPLNHGYIAVVDDEDYEHLSKYKWYAKFGKSKSPYAARCQWNKGTKTTIRMHREITSCPAHLTVDHLNNDTLDNRKSNLDICSRSENSKRRFK